MLFRVLSLVAVVVLSTAWSSSAQAEEGKLSVCDAVKRINESGGWQYRVAKGVDCSQKPIRLVERKASRADRTPRYDTRFFETQAMFGQGLLLVETDTGTELRTTPPALRKALDAARNRCLPKKKTKAHVQEGGVLLRAHVVDAGAIDWHKLEWVLGGESETQCLGDSGVKALRAFKSWPLSSGKHVIAVRMGKAANIARGAFKPGALDLDKRLGKKPAPSNPARVSQSAIDRAIDRDRERYFACFERASGRNQGTRSVTLLWKVNARGDVTHIDVEKSNVPSSVSGCLKDRLRGTVFEVPKGAEEAEARYTFNFRSMGMLGGVPDVGFE